MWRLMILFLLAGSVSKAQDVGVLMKEAQNAERSLKESEALEKYNQVLTADPTNVQALVKAAEINAAKGARLTDKKAKKNTYEAARVFADKALVADPNSADAHYIRAVIAGKLTETENDTKKLVEHVRDTKEFADKALALNPNHARANYVAGKWHFEMVDLNWAKKAAVKLLYGGLPQASMEKAVEYMEKARILDQYFVLNYLDLAKAYKYDNKPAKAIEVLNKLIKLPTRTPDDPHLKEEGRKMLSELQ